MSKDAHFADSKNTSPKNGHSFAEGSILCPYLPTQQKPKNHEKTPNNISQFYLYIDMHFFKDSDLLPTNVISKDVVPFFRFWKQMDEIHCKQNRTSTWGYGEGTPFRRMHIIFSPKIEHCFLGIIGPRILNRSQLTSPSNQQDLVWRLQIM